MRNSILIAVIIGLAGCYSPDPQYTSLHAIKLSMDNADSVFADSLTVHRVVIAIPGLRHDADLPVVLKTDWGEWSDNNAMTTTHATYYDSLGYFSTVEYLKPSRTVAPFSITVTSNNSLTETFRFTSVARLPDKIQIMSDSVAMKRQAGNTAKIKVNFYSRIGYPSFGFRFSFLANDSLAFNPITSEFTHPSAVTTGIQILGSTIKNKITISGKIDNVAKQPEIIPITVFLKP